MEDYSFYMGGVMNKDDTLQVIVDEYELDHRDEFLKAALSDGYNAGKRDGSTTERFEFKKLLQCMCDTYRDNIKALEQIMEEL